MPNFYCEYCGIYLKHSSPFGRKQHSRGKKHNYNKVEYYSQFLIEFQQQHQCTPKLYLLENQMMAQQQQLQKPPVFRPPAMMPP